MDDSLKNLEASLETLVPRGLSDEGQARCHSILDELLADENGASPEATARVPWLGTAAAAAVALSLGIGGGWYLGQTRAPGLAGEDSTGGQELLHADFDQLDREAWLLTEDAPDVYVARNGEIREITHEVEVTKDTVKHRESGVVVTVETTDHHVVDSVKSEF